jgi:hypothetical protein
MQTIGGDWHSWLAWFFEWLRNQFGGGFPT